MFPIASPPIRTRIITASTRPSRTSFGRDPRSGRHAKFIAPTRSPSSRSRASIAPWAERARDRGATAIHRSLLHRRYPTPLTDRTAQDASPRQLSRSPEKPASPSSQCRLLRIVSRSSGASRGIGYATALALARAGALWSPCARGRRARKKPMTRCAKPAVRRPRCRSNMRDYDGFYRSLGFERALPAARRASRQCRVAGQRCLRPCHVPAAWDSEAMAINVTANWHLIRAMDGLLRRSAAGRVPVLRDQTRNTRAYAGYSVSKALVHAAQLTRQKPARRRCASICSIGPTRPVCAPMSCRARTDDAADARRVAEKILDCVPAGLRRNRQAL